METALAARKLRLALDLYEVGEQLQRQRLRRGSPTADVAEIEAELRAWRVRRSGQLAGHHPGRPSARFE
jgi:hypothetical protein